MQERIQLIDFQPDYTEQVVRLLSSLYSSIQTELDWQKQYFKSPDGEAVISLAIDSTEKRLVAHFSAIKISMMIFNKKYLCAKGEGEIFDLEYMKDLLRHGTKIDHTLSTRLVKHTAESSLEKGIDLICTNPSDLALKSHLEAGYELLKHRFDIFVMVFSVRYLNHLLLKKSRVFGFFSPVIKLFLNVLNTTAMVFYKSKEVILEPVNTFDNRIHTIMRNFSDRYDCVMIERTKDHLNWRFAGKEYDKYLIRSNKGEVTGYVVLHTFLNANGFKEMILVDYLFKPDCWDALPGAIKKIVRLAKETSCDFLRINYLHDYKENLGVAKILKSLFFLSRYDKRNIVIFTSKNLESVKNRILDIKNWFFTDLYFEGY